jgi:hypothetical protein
VTLTAADRERVIRLVVRRCRLNLVELRPGRVVVHHWGQQGQAALRPFFKKHSLAKQGVEVFLIDRKREVVTARPGDDFLYGERLAPSWLWKAYRTKWQRRAVEEPDDWTAAPHTWSGFALEGQGILCCVVGEYLGGFGVVCPGHPVPELWVRRFDVFGVGPP